MKYIHTLFVLLFVTATAIAQRPQHVSTGNDKEEGLWESTTGIILFVVFIVLMILGRNLSKRIHKKRDELRNQDNG
jgi:hypothetical protein